MKDFFLFRRMLIPYLVQVLFWLGIVTCIVLAITDFSQGGVWRGIGTLILGPIIIRMACEYVVVLFRINDTLTEIKHLKENS